ncbi:DUF1853 family protein [Microbulbifer pacificus]|uniref:DUF1853 family protein n=1 Tax=Microbulbifer pacificus TaxID=407164 RepID=UPI000CF450F7|nr:DUF1853 family protein [Microbulbifer pacificus]
MTLPFTHAVPEHWSNLLWALSSLEIAPDFPLPWLPPARHQQLYRFFAAPEVTSRLRSELELSLHDLKSQRLGIYFEQLWAFAFTHHPDYTLLARNLPIRTGQKTLGELDFVVRYLPDDTVEHWEVAVKFYLQVDHFWVGPGLRDRLDIKLARMRDHQLPVARSHPAVATLEQQKLHFDRQWAVMPGRLFSSHDKLPSHTTGTYWWTDTASFLDGIAPTALHWRLLPKQTWLASGEPTHPAANERQYTGSELSQLTTRGPICVAGFDQHSEVSRGFIVPDGWYERAREVCIPPPAHGG